MYPKLTKPPLVEAVCELRLDPNVPWDLTMPGRLFEKLQPQFPERRQTLGLELKVNIQSLPQSPDYRQIENLQFLSPDNKDVVQIREHAVSVSRLAPYGAWEKYKPTALGVFEKFKGVAGESTIARVGLKYINRIVVPKPEIRLEEYFDLYPQVGNKLPQRHGPFLVGVIFPFEDSSDWLRAEITSANPDNPDQYHVLFSLDYYTTSGELISFEALPGWLETAHERIEEAFHATLKAITMQLFE
jgi:uncharacterized protein (TIGR04255 family)